MTGRHIFARLGWTFIVFSTIFASDSTGLASDTPGLATVSMGLASVYMGASTIQEAAQELGDSAQVNPYQGWESLLQSSFDPRLHQNVGENFKLATSPEVRFLVDQAKDAIRDESYAKAVRFLQELIDDYSNSVYQVAPTRYLGAGEIARFLLGRMPDEGKKAYERLVGGSIRPQLETALAQRNTKALRDLYSRFDLSEAGRKALLISADAAFEVGDFEFASLLWRRALAFSHPEDRKLPEIYTKLGLAQTALGQSAGDLVSVLKNSKVLNRGALSSGAELLGSESGEGRVAQDSDWPTINGSNDRNRHASWPLLESTLPKAWMQALFDTNQDNPMAAQAYSFPFFPIRVGDNLVISDSMDVWAVNLFASDEHEWVFKGPLSASGSGRSYLINSGPRGRRRQSPISQNAIAGLCEERGVVLANLLQPIQGEYTEHELEGRVINTPIPTRVLVALDGETGEMLWTTHRTEGPDAAFLRKLSIPSPPAIIGGLVAAYGYYFEGGVNAFLVLLDLKTGELISETSICISQIELTMFGMPFHEHTTPAVSSDDNGVYICTNLGLMVALDPITGWVRWISEYKTIPIQAAKHFLKPNPRDIFWKNSPPILADNAVFVAPHDASEMFAFERYSGVMRWHGHDMFKRHSRETRLDSVLGVDGGVLVATGYDLVSGIDVKTGRGVWNASVSRDVASRVRVAGRGQISDGKVIVPTTLGLAIFNTSDGAPHGDVIQWTNPIPTDPSGNLLVFADAVIASGQRHIQVYFDLEKTFAEARDRYDQDEARFSDLVLLADLSRLKGDDASAIDYYDRALLKAKDERVATRDISRVESGLYRSCFDVGQYHERFGRLDKAATMFRRAREFARGPNEDLKAGMQLLAVLKGLDLPDAYVALTLELDRSYGHQIHNPLLGVEGPVGLTLIQMLADFYRDHELFSDEVQTLQRLMGRYGDTWFGVSTVRDYCFRRIRERILDEGRGIYARLDEQATRLVEAAITERDPDAMLHVMDSFPNAANIADYAMALGDLLLEGKRYGELFNITSRFLDDYPNVAAAVPLRLLLAQAAIEMGNRDLAVTLSNWARSQIEHKDDGPAFPNIPPAVVHETVTPFSIRVASRGSIPKEDGRPDLIEVNDSDSFANLPGMLIKGPDTVSAVPSLDWDGDVKIDWTFKFDDGVWNLLEAHHIADVLVMAVEQIVIGIDTKTGLERWSVPLRSDVISQFHAEGVLVVATEIIGEGTSSQLVAIEPRTGSVLWSRELEGRPPNWIRIGDGLIVVERPQSRPSISTLDVISLTTGRVLWEGTPFNKRWRSELSILSTLDLLLVPSTPGDEDGPTRDATITAYSTRDMSVKWSLPNANLRQPPKILEGNLIAIQVQNPTGRHQILVVDAVSGELVRDVMIPRGWEALPVNDPSGDSQSHILIAKQPSRGGSDISDPIEIAGLYPVLQSAPKWSVTLDGTKGQFTELEAHRFGDTYLVSYNLVPVGVNKNVTEFFLIDSRSGAILDRETLDPPGAQYFSRAKVVRMGDSLVARKVRHLFSIQLATQLDVQLDGQLDVQLDGDGGPLNEDGSQSNKDGRLREDGK